MDTILRIVEILNQVDNYDEFQRLCTKLYLNLDDNLDIIELYTSILTNQGFDEFSIKEAISIHLMPF